MSPSPEEKPPMSITAHAPASLTTLDQLPLLRSLVD